MQIAVEDHLLPARPRRRRGEPRVEVRAQLLAAAARLMAAGGPLVPMQRIRQEARVSAHCLGVYSNVEALLTDLLTEHLIRVGEAVALAEAAAASLPPAQLLERLILAWLDATAGGQHAHRVLLTCVHVLPEAARRSIALRERMIVEQIEAALAAAVPSLAGRADAMIALFPVIRRALTDAHAWPDLPAAEQRRADARRLAGALLAIAEAEAAGYWPSLGRAAGPEPGVPSVIIDCRRIRRHLRHVLDAVAAGADIAITRRRRVVARIVPGR